MKGRSVIKVMGFWDGVGRALLKCDLEEIRCRKRLAYANAVRFLGRGRASEFGEGRSGLWESGSPLEQGRAVSISTLKLLQLKSRWRSILLLISR